jgi:hypothetical protein
MHRVHVPEADEGKVGSRLPSPRALSRGRERGSDRRAVRDSVTLLKRGPLAQLVEQETLNLLVVGSTPTRPTIFHRDRDRPNP